MEKKEQKSGVKWKILAGGILLAVSCGIYFFAEPQTDFSNREPEIRIEEDVTLSEVPVIPEEPVLLVVDVGGAVIFPGVLELPEGSRVYEAVDAAGGLTEDADIRNINLAAPIHDGEKIYIPTKEEAEQMMLTGGGTITGKVNINTANSAALQTLNGVGPATAAAIIEYRTENGPFGKAEDLMNVNGIGKKTFENLKDHIRVSCLRSTEKLLV
ncbi:MAG: hypothetical protein E7224_07345 [Clostridiales bacterium]|nr:hypothetical protein [Clostridiales bacterium]